MRKSVPWSINKRGEQWCVVKQGEDQPVPGGCHASRADAVKHQRALYASEASAEGSKVSEMVIGEGAFQIGTSASSTSQTYADLGSVTVTVANGDEPSETMPIWEGILGIEGLPTADRRYLIPGEISERELPLTLYAQFSNEEGHKDAKVAARIDEIWRVPNEERSPNAVEIWGRGPFDSGEHGREAARLVEEQFLRGISLDFSVSIQTILI